MLRKTSHEESLIMGIRVPCLAGQGHEARLCVLAELGFNLARAALVPLTGPRERAIGFTERA